MSLQRTVIERLLAFVGDDTLDIPLRTPDPLDDRILTIYLELRYGNEKAIALLADAASRDRSRSERWLRDRDSYTSQRRFLETFAPAAVSKDDLREHLCDSMHDPVNFVTYERFISTLTDAAFAADARYRSIPVQKWDLSPDRAQLLKEFDRAYLDILY